MKAVVGVIVGVVVGYLVVVPLFERLAPRRWVRAYQRTMNPLFRWWTGVVPGWAVIETTGRRSGLPRQVPVGGRLRNDVFWLVAGDGRYSAYVKNIEADPKVRLKAHGRWRTGTAQVLPDDNARRRLLRISPINSVFVLISAKHPLTIRIDLDPVS